MHLVNHLTNLREALLVLDAYLAEPDLHQMISWVGEGVESTGGDGPVLPTGTA